MKIKLVGIHPRQEEILKIRPFNKLRNISYPIEVTLISEGSHYFVDLMSIIGSQGLWSVSWFKTNNVIINDYVKNYHENPPFINDEYYD